MALFDLVRSDSEPGVDTVGIYVENHHGVNRECFTWIRFDNMKLSEKGSLLHLREDPLISETCPLEESASHHVVHFPKSMRQQISEMRTWDVMSFSHNLT